MASAMEANFLTDEEVDRVQSFGIPVDSSCPAMHWIIALDRESFMPTDTELAQLKSYCEFVVKRLYNETWQKRILQEPLPKCGGHHTLIFLNGMRPRMHYKGQPAGTWFFRRRLWREGPRYVPYVNEVGVYRPHALTQLMDRIEDVSHERWQEWKQMHRHFFGNVFRNC